MRSCCKLCHPSLILFIHVHQEELLGKDSQQSKENIPSWKSRMRKPKGKRLVIFLTLLHFCPMFSSGPSWIVTSYRRYIFAKRNNLIDLDFIVSFPASHSHPSPSVWVRRPHFCFWPWNLALTNWKWSLPSCMSHFRVTCKFCCLGGSTLVLKM